MQAQAPAGALHALLDTGANIAALPGVVHGLQKIVLELGAGFNGFQIERGLRPDQLELLAAALNPVGTGLGADAQPVYAFVGDGSYLMLHTELQTAVQEGLKIVVLLFDNAGFGCINNLQMGQGMGSFGTENRHRDPDSGALIGPLVRVDFAKNAESYGCVSYRVHDEAGLEAALVAAVREKRPVLIDIKVLPKTMTHGYEEIGRAHV